MKYIFLITILIAFIYGFTHQKHYNFDSVIADMKVQYREYLNGLAKNVEIPIINNWEDFIQVAITLSNQYGVPPAVTVGQASIETGHGTSVRAQRDNNYFGMRVYSDSAAGSSYESPIDSIKDYLTLITTAPRYREAFGNRNDPEKMIQSIKDAGYAEDPNYVRKVVNTSEFKALSVL